MPLRRLFVGIGCPQDRFLIARPPRELQPNRKAIGSETTGDCHRGKPIEVERTGVLSQERNDVRSPLTSVDLGGADLECGDRQGGSSQEIHALEQMKAMLVEKGAGPLGLKD